MFDLEEDAVVGGPAEAAAGDGHISISGIVDVFDYLLNALKTALHTAMNALDAFILALNLFQLLEEVVNDHSDCVDDGDDQ